MSVRSEGVPGVSEGVRSESVRNEGVKDVSVRSANQE